MNARHSAVRAVSLAATAETILGPNDKRVALLFSPPLGATTYTVSNDRSVALGAGLHLTSNSGPIEITLDTHGDAVTRAWWGIASAATTVGLLEVVG